MELHFGEMKEAVEIARGRGLLTDKVRLVLMGRLGYAAQRGDVTQQEYEAIVELIGLEFVLAHEDEMTVAEIGLRDRDLGVAQSEAAA